MPKKAKFSGMGTMINLKLKAACRNRLGVGA
jgi:hypothetical protein